MGAEAAQVVVPLTLRRTEAQELAAAVRGLLTASQRVLNGGRRLDADEVKAVRRLATRAMMVTYHAEEHQYADVIDLAAERRRRRR
ncbi:hypothetical protein [Nonomuraea sp. NPDC050786]|uniref:hypothetical protein n=1 Tax=Nonomuraea sp. NPDC050786 TaxID=3154840 RepID=UPI0033EF92CB